MVFPRQLANILLGQAFGRGSTKESKVVVVVGMLLSLTLAMILGAMVMVFPRQLANIFSNEATVLDEFEKIRFPLGVVTALMNFSVALERVPVAMGRTRMVLFFGLIGSWIGQVPGVFLCTLLWRKDLVGLFTGMCIGYGILCCMYVVLIMRTNFEKIVREAAARAEAKS